MDICSNELIVIQSIESVVQLFIESLNHFQYLIQRKRIDIKWRKNVDEKKEDPFVINEDGCPTYSYRTRVIHRNPLIISIEHFLNEEEIDHLIQLS